MYTSPISYLNMMRAQYSGKRFMLNKLLTCDIISLQQACVHKNNSCRICQILQQTLSSSSPLNKTPSILFMHKYFLYVFYSWLKSLSSFSKYNVVFTWRKLKHQKQEYYQVAVISLGYVSNTEMLWTVVKCLVFEYNTQPRDKCFSLRIKFYWVSSSKMKLKEAAFVPLEVS